MHDRLLPAIPKTDTRITYKQLVSGISLTGDYFRRPESVADTINFGKFVGERILRRVPQVLLVTADGYPYYVSRLRSPLIPVAEIGRFQDELLAFYSGKVVERGDFAPGEPITLEQLRKIAPSAGMKDWYGSEKRGVVPVSDVPSGRQHTIEEWAAAHDVEFADDIWPCPEHIETGNLPNLRDSCASCTLTGMKPRDVMRLWHDVDLPLVVDGDPRLIAPLIREALHDDEILCNDENLGFTIHQAGKTFPVDVTVISKDEWLQGLDRILREPDYLGVNVPAIKLWLHDEPVTWPLGINFAIGMEPVIARADNGGTLKAYNAALRRFNQDHDPDEVISRITELPRFHGRVIQSDNVQTGVRDRLQQGGAPFVEFVDSTQPELPRQSKVNRKQKRYAGTHTSVHELDKYVNIGADGPNTVTIAIDSMDDLIQDVIRGKKGAHQSAIAELDRYVAMGYDVKTNITIYPLNYATVLESVAELYQHGVRKFSFQYGSVGNIPDAAQRESEHVDPVAWRALVEQLHGSWSSFLESDIDPENRIQEFTLPYIFFTPDELIQYVIGDETRAQTYFEHVDEIERGVEKPMPFVACGTAASRFHASESDTPVSCTALAAGQAGMIPAQFEADTEVSDVPQGNEVFAVPSSYLCPAMPQATGGRTSDRIQTKYGPLYHGCRDITTYHMPIILGQFSHGTYLQYEATYGKMAAERLQRSLLVRGLLDTASVKP